MDITVKRLTKSYGEKTVLKDFSATFKEGKVTVIMGKSGSGKTTLLNCIASATSYDGEISGAGEVSYVFQEDRLVPHLTVYGNLSLCLNVQDKREKAEKIRGILEKFDMKDKADCISETLSGGEKKRVALARAFLSGREVMLLDEPFNSLDFGLKKKIDEYFLNLIKSEMITAIFVTHDLDEAIEVADTVLVINGNGVEWSYDFKTDKGERKQTDAECVSVREKLIKLLY